MTSRFKNGFQNLAIRTLLGKFAHDRLGMFFNRGWFSEYILKVTKYMKVEKCQNLQTGSPHNTQRPEYYNNFSVSSF